MCLLKAHGCPDMGWLGLHVVVIISDIDLPHEIFAINMLSPFWAWLNYNAMFYKTFICFYRSVFISVFLHECLMMLNDVVYTAFKMFVTQMSNYLFVISFQLMLYETLRYRLARAFETTSQASTMIRTVRLGSN